MKSAIHPNFRSETEMNAGGVVHRGGGGPSLLLSQIARLGARLAVCLAFVCPTASALADTSGNFNYTDNGTSITITGYVNAPTGALDIPPSINGKPVTSIGSYAYMSSSGLTSVTIPGSVTRVQDKNLQSRSERERVILSRV